MTAAKRHSPVIAPPLEYTGTERVVCSRCGTVEHPGWLDEICVKPIGLSEQRNMKGCSDCPHPDYCAGMEKCDAARLLECVERWPECESGAYDPRCCRFPKSCSCTSGVGEREGQDAAWKSRLLALAQLVTAPLVLAWFFVVEPELIPEWPGYVGRCVLCIADGRRR